MFLHEVNQDTMSTLSKEELPVGSELRARYNFCILLITYNMRRVSSREEYLFQASYLFDSMHSTCTLIIPYCYNENCNKKKRASSYEDMFKIKCTTVFLNMVYNLLHYHQGQIMDRAKSKVHSLAVLVRFRFSIRDNG